MNQIIKFLKDLISPKKCYSCKKEWHFLCMDCLNNIWFFTEICPICKQYSKNFQIHFYCKKQNIYYDKIIILTHYKNKIIKKLIKDAKFYQTKDILEDFAFYMWKYLNKYLLEDKKDILLIPSPMYFLKKLIRWYNQSEILVKNIWEVYDIEFDLNLIKKIKSTKAQSHLNRNQRLENLKNAFTLDINKIKKYRNKTIIIVDDVISTWTTINEVSKILKQNWVKNIYWFCIASD